MTAAADGDVCITAVRHASLVYGVCVDTTPDVSGFVKVVPTDRQKEWGAEAYDCNVLRFQPVGRQPLVPWRKQHCAPAHEPYHKCQWMVGVCQDTLYVAFKGSSEAVDAVIDISFTDVETRRGLRVHSGVYSGVQEELPAIRGALADAQCLHPHIRTVIFTGHSLGGSYAAAAMLEMMADPDPSPRDYPHWPRELTAECITFGAPLCLSERTEAAGMRLPHGASRGRITNFVLNYDLVPRLLALPTPALISLLEEAPRVLAGGLVGAVASMALRHGGLRTDRLGVEFEELRGSYHAAGTYVFLQHAALPRPTDAGVGQPRGWHRASAIAVVHPTGGCSSPTSNPVARRLLAHFPVCDPGIVCWEGQSKTGFVEAAFSDHWLARGYVAAIEHALGNRPDQWSRAMLSADCGRVRLQDGPLPCSLGQAPPLCARAAPVGPRSAPWCVNSRVAEHFKATALPPAAEDKRRHAPTRVVPWEAAVPPHGNALLRGLKEGEILRLVSASSAGKECIAVTLPIEQRGGSHISVEYSGLLGYVVWESNFVDVGGQNTERDFRPLWPAAVRDQHLHLHKLTCYCAAAAGSAWHVSTQDAGCPGSDWEPRDVAPTCRGCLTSLTGFGGRDRQHCHRCGLTFCRKKGSDCCIYAMRLHVWGDKPVPVCKKCLSQAAADTAACAGVYRAASVWRRSRAAALCLQRLGVDSKDVSSALACGI